VHVVMQLLRIIEHLGLGVQVTAGLNDIPLPSLSLSSLAIMNDLAVALSQGSIKWLVLDSRATGTGWGA